MPYKDRAPMERSHRNPTRVWRVFDDVAGGLCKREHGLSAIYRLLKGRIEKACPRIRCSRSVWNRRVRVHIDRSLLPQELEKYSIESELSGSKRKL